jgi:uncharacterized oligopeptide transporter (OPT) family protein
MIVLSFIGLLEIYYLAIIYYVNIGHHQYKKIIFITISLFLMITIAVTGIILNMNKRLCDFMKEKNEEWKSKGIYVEVNPIFLTNFYKIDKGYNPINEYMMDTFEKII